MLTKTSLLTLLVVTLTATFVKTEATASDVSGIFGDEVWSVKDCLNGCAENSTEHELVQ